MPGGRGVNGPRPRSVTRGKDARPGTARDLAGLRAGLRRPGGPAERGLERRL